MRAILIAASLLFLSTGAFAAEPPLPEDVALAKACIARQEAKQEHARACIDAVSGPCLAKEENHSTAGMHGCIARAIAVWDGMLNDYYSKARALMDENGRNGLRDVQRAWIAYRDKLCEFARMPAEGGTLAGVLQGGCVEAETASRALALHSLVEHQLKN